MSGPVGKPTPYIDAVAKVTGQIKYSADFFEPNMLYVKYLRSIHPHALITSIDTAEARACPGVIAVAIGTDLPIPFGVLTVSHDENAMAVEKVRHVGEIVAAVAAESEEAAEAGVGKIAIEYELLQSFQKPEDSLEVCDDNQQIHAHGKNGTNIHKMAELSFNDPKKALEESDVIATESFEFEGVSHGFLEPHATLANYSQDGILTVTTATQVPHYLHRSISEVLELPMHLIRVIKPALGGGFGGKSDPYPHEIIAAYLSYKTKRPVKTVFSREEVFLAHHGRHGTKLTMSIGADKTGKLTGLDADIVIDGGAYGSFGVVTTYYNGVLLQGPYRIDQFGFRTRRVYTNKPQCGAMRGHGAVNPRYAAETLIDMLAEKLQIDPCDLRLKNFLPADTLTVGQLRITSNGIRECMEAVREKSGWDQRFRKLPFGHGLGVGCGFYISGSALPIIWNRYPQTVVHAKLDLDGRIVIFSGASDIGQGSDTMLAQIAAEVLGQPIERVRVETADTMLTPIDLGSYSSRVTFMVGNAAKSAVEKIRDRIAEAIASEKKVARDDLIFKDGCVSTVDGSLKLDWDEAVEIGLANRGSLVETGNYISPKMGGKFKGSGAGLSPAYSFGAFISEVKVDPETGQVRVVKVWGAHDCGKAINPLAVEGQIEGCIHMGLGQVISEEVRHENGLVVNANFTDYRMPTAADTPEMDITIVESNDREGPFGAKEAGEGPIHPVLPSIGNAVYDAVGVRMTHLPMTPDRVLAKLRAGGDR